MDKDEKEEQRITYEVMHKGQMKSTNVCTISVPDGQTNWIDAHDLSKKRTICQRNEQTECTSVPDGWTNWINVRDLSKIRISVCTIVPDGRTNWMDAHDL